MTRLTCAVGFTGKKSQHLAVDIAPQAADTQSVRPQVELPPSYQQRPLNVPVATSDDCQGYLTFST